MFQWAQKTFDQISQTVAPPPTDGPGRFAYCVQRNEEEKAMGCIVEFDPVFTVVNQAKGWNPIHMACQYSQTRLIGLLLNQPGMNIEQQDATGNTSLHHACMSTDARALEVVQMLVNQCGANVLAKNSEGKTPYDLASSNNVRQFLLPIQLQKETQIALDNGGQGLPPGIDLGGLRIKNSTMAPPPMSFGSPAPRTQSTGAYPPTPQPGDPNKIASAPASMPVDVPTNTGAEKGYSLRGSSSAAIFSSKYTADGFHTSSSDTRLQQKYGHDTSQRYVTAPPPSSGSVPSLAPAVEGAPSSGNGANNPFTRGSALPKQRYVAYGLAAAPAAPIASAPAYNQYPAAVPANNFSTFTPGSFAAQQPAVPSTPTQPVQSNTNTPTTPYMPPPPYQSHNYETPSKRPEFVSPAAATYGGSPATPAPPQSGGSAQDIFAAPSPAVKAPASGGSAQELFASPKPKDDEDANIDSENKTVVPATAEVAKDGEQDATPTDSTSEKNVAQEENPSVSGEEPHPAPDAAANGGETKSDWVEATDPTSGQVYYYNVATEETSWEKPDSLQPQSESTGSDWVETPDPASGKTYYYNKVTHETSWENPIATNASGDEWVETVDASTGQTYYYNQKTQETSWEKPSNFAPTDQASDLGSDWVETMDPNTGQIYYYNEVTHETSWEKPVTSETEKIGEQSENAESSASDGPPVESSDIPDGWIETIDPSSGKMYYYNEKTQETSWEKPAAPSNVVANENDMKQEVEESAEVDEHKEESSKETVMVESEKAPATSAHELFGDASSSKEQSVLDTSLQSEEVQTVSGGTKDNDGQTASPQDVLLSEQSEPKTAEQLFGAGEESRVVTDSTPVDSTTIVTNEAVVDKKEEIETDKLDEVKAEVEDLDGDGEMLDVPLSPEPTVVKEVSVTEMEPEPSTQAQDLFSAIGMPPPPFQSKR